MNLFYEYMLNNREVMDEVEEISIMCSYFTMCYLVPEEPFRLMVQKLGGIQKCNKTSNIRLLSYYFQVEENMIRARIKSLELPFLESPLKIKIDEESQLLQSYISNYSSENRTERVGEKVVEAERLEEVFGGEQEKINDDGEEPEDK